LTSTKKSFPRDWEPMTSKLIEAGLFFDGNNPIIVLQIQTACFLSILDIAKKLLRPDVEEKARGKRST